MPNSWAAMHLSRRLLLLALLGGAISLALSGDRLRGLLLNSLWLSIGAITIALPLGTLFAIVLAKTTLPGRRFFLWLIFAWLFIPLFVQAAAWQAALGTGGWLLQITGSEAQGLLFTGWPAAIWVHGVAGIAWVTLLITAALQTVPREVEEDALLNAAPWKVLFTVSLPGTLPAIWTGALWVAVLCLGEIAVTDLFRIRTFAEEVYTSASVGSLSGPLVPLADDAGQVDFVTRDLACGTVLAISAVLVLLAAISSWLPGAHFYSLDESWCCELKSALLPVTLITWFLFILMVGVPVLSLIGKSGMQASRSQTGVTREWTATKAAQLVLRSPWEHRREIGWTLAIGITAATLATGFGVLIAWALRTGRLPASLSIVFLAVLFALPGPLVGVWLIRLLNHPPESVWAWLNSWYDHSILAPVLAQGLRALPLVTLLIWSQLASISQQVLDSAKCEGANWWTQLVRIAIPLRVHTLLAAFSLAMVVAVGELAATILVVPPGVSTLSIRIFGLMHYGADDLVSAVCLALGLVLGLAALAVGWLLNLLKP